MNDRHAGLEPRRRSRRAEMALAMAMSLVSLVAGLVEADVWSAFSGTTSNSSNSFSTGTVTVSDNDSDVAMFNSSELKPGDTATACLKVTYNGSLASTMTLYGSTTGTGLDAYLNLRVTRGVYSPSESAFSSCANFAADATDYIGAGPGVVYDGVLQAYPDSHGTGIVDPTAGSPESWTTNEVHVYRFDVTVVDDNSAQGKSAIQTFTFEARNQ